MSEDNLDCIYIAAHANDARFTRICVASIRRCYPAVPIRLLASGPLQAGLSDELKDYWGVERADLPAADFGWGFVKLEPLFGPHGQRFLVLDSDTVLTGPVLDLWRSSTAPFLVDDETKSQTDTNRLYYDWQKLRAIDRDAHAPQFVFNSGQWFGTAGVLTRDDFAAWIEWTLPRRLKHPECFMPGEQGVLNYVLNRKAAAGDLRVERCKLMRWPGHSMDGLDARQIAERTAPALVVHWAGMKKARLGAMAGSDLLLFFEDYYYRHVPGGQLRRLAAIVRHHVIQWRHFVAVRMTLLLRKLAGTGR